MVSKLGEEKVNPLSVPASYGKSSSVTLSFQWSPSHRSTLSTPTNQSGLGTSRTINDSCRGRKYKIGKEVECREKKKREKCKWTKQ